MGLVGSRSKAVTSSACDSFICVRHYCVTEKKDGLDKQRTLTVNTKFWGINVINGNDFVSVSLQR